LKSQNAAFLAAEADVLRLTCRSGFSRDAFFNRVAQGKGIPAEAAPATALASARRSALLCFSGPLQRRWTADETARRGARTTRARSPSAQDALSANLGRRSRTFRAGCAEGDAAGLPFLLVPFLWASKEKEPARRDAGRTRTDASRLLRHRKRSRQLDAQPFGPLKNIPGFRRNDNTKGARPSNGMEAIP